MFISCLRRQETNQRNAARWIGVSSKNPHKNDCCYQIKGGFLKHPLPRDPQPRLVKRGSFTCNTIVNWLGFKFSRLYNSFGYNFNKILLKVFAKPMFSKKTRKAGLLAICVSFSLKSLPPEAPRLPRVPDKSK